MRHPSDEITVTQVELETITEALELASEALSIKLESEAEHYTEDELASIEGRIEQVGLLRADLLGRYPDPRLRVQRTVEIEYDGVNPAVYTIPEGITLSIYDETDSQFVGSVEGPFKGEWPEREDD